MYEKQKARPLTRGRFAVRVLSHLGVASAVIALSVGLGTLGYRAFGDLGWGEAFVHAATPLGGLGISHIPSNTAGQLFAGLYALYGGLVFLVVTGVVYAPILHRLVHHFHWDEEEEDDPRIP